MRDLLNEINATNSDDFWNEVYDLLERENLVNKKFRSIKGTATKIPPEQRIGNALMLLKKNAEMPAYPIVAFGDYSSNWTEVLSWEKFIKLLKKQDRVDLTLVDEKPGKIEIEHGASFT